MVTSGCDSCPLDEISLDAAYLADGDWTFGSVAGGPETTARIDALLDDCTLAFGADGSVRTDIDMSDTVRDDDTRDITFDGTCTLSGSTRAAPATTTDSPSARSPRTG